jgi:hypothetical protein
MKATDLRIGNLFYYRVVDQLDERKEWFEVSEIDYDDLRVIGIKDEMNQDYQPIPITEEWLLKFGFKKYITGDIYPTFTKNMLNWNDGIFYLIRYGFINHIKHVHQLQNLYFALTGIELTIKDLQID